jgi:Cdc6-like AAA superfamily ATPase
VARRAFFCARFVIATHGDARCGCHVVTVSLRAARKKTCRNVTDDPCTSRSSLIGRRWAIDVRRASILVATTTLSRSRATGALRDTVAKLV